MNKNISNNYIKCAFCKNIFLKTHIKIHYQNCKKIYDKKSQRECELNYESDNQLNNQTNNQINNQTNNQLNFQLNFQLDHYISPKLINYTDSVLNHFFKKYEELFTEFVKDKCIAIVGPAQSITGTGKGNIIDKFDLVIRLNKSIPLPESMQDDIGTKTDIIYNSLNTSDFPGENKLDPKLYKKYGVKFVCSSYPFNHNIFHDDIINYVYKYKFELPLKVMNDNKFKNLERLLGTRPYTGTCAIMDILSYPIKYLYITGLDFYQTKYYSNYRRITKEALKYSKNSPIHQCKPQLEYLKNISFYDNRIILDTYLDKLLYHDYYKVVKNLLTFDVNNIFNFGDMYLKKYFEMKISECTYTKNNINNYKKYDGTPIIVFTDNKFFNKNPLEYCIFITNEKNMLNVLNNNLESKKFIGNFYFKDTKNGSPSIYLNEKFLNNLKLILQRVGIDNCNINLVILLSIITYLPKKHFFSNNEIFNHWKLNVNEKKLVLFLIKKNILIVN